MAEVEGTRVGKQGGEVPRESLAAWLVHRLSDSVGHKCSLDICLGQRLESPRDYEGT